MVGFCSRLILWADLKNFCLKLIILRIWSLNPKIYYSYYFLLMAEKGKGEKSGLHNKTFLVKSTLFIFK